MRLLRGNGLECIQFPALVNYPGFFHGIFLRQVHHVNGDTEDFDLGLGHGSPDAIVWQNRNKMLNFIDPDCYGVYAHQVHGKNVCIYRSNDVGTNSTRLNGDALITDSAGVALVIQVADCQPILLIDPATGVIANIHSGWRGSIQNIIAETIRRMVLEHHCRPEDLICGIGPSLGPCCAEFVHYKDEIPVSLWEYCRTGRRFDFWQISIDQLIQTGVRSENIHLAGICTKCNQHLFFSYRGDRHAGRFAAVVGIRSGRGEHD